MKTFLKTGCIVCALFLLGALFYEWLHPEIYITASATPDSQPITRISTEKPTVVLTFETAAGNDNTAGILDILDKYEIHAVFFVTGSWADQHPDLLKRIADSGHDLGNHSETHKNMTTLDADECRQEIMTLHEKVKELTGVEMNLFRPPYDSCSARLIQTAADCGYTVIGLDCDSMDWKNYGADAIVHTVLDHPDLESGSIIRMNCSAPYTPDALETIIRELKERGCGFAPLSQYT